MTDIQEIEKRTVYRIPDDFMVHAPYVGSEPWTEGTMTVDGDMMPVEQQAIPWCITHDLKYDEATFEGIQYCDDGTLMGEPCHISTGGPHHKWWVDL